MSRARKYSPGRVLSFADVAEMTQQRRYVFQGEKPQHPGWVQSMQFGTVLWLVNQGMFREALLNPDYVKRVVQEAKEEELAW